MALSVRFKTILVLLMSGLCVYVGVLNLADRFAWRQPIDDVEWVQTKRGVEVGREPRAEPAASALQVGDLLVSVQDIPVGDVDGLTEIRDFLAATLPPGSPAKYVLQRGEDQIVTAALPILTESGVSSGSFLLAAVALAYLLIGLFIFLRHWRSAGAFHFFLLCLVAFVLFLFRHSGRADAFDLLVYWCNDVALLLLPPLFLHFCLCFPRPVAWLAAEPRRKFALYLPAIGLGVIHVLWFMGLLQPIGLARSAPVNRFFEHVYLLHFLLLVGTAALVLWRTASVRGVSDVHRHQMKWVAYGTAAGFTPFAALYAVPYLMGWSIGLVAESSVLSLALLPLSFGYAITRYRLMDVDLIFKKSVAYVLSTATLLGVYVVIVVAIGQALRELWSGAEPLLFAVAAMLVALAFAPLKERIQELIDRSLYKDRYGYRQTFSDFGKTLNSEINLPQVIEKVCSRLKVTLDLEATAVFLREDGSPTSYTLFATEAWRREPARLEISEPALAKLCDDSSALFPESESEEVLARRAQLRELGLVYFHPLQVHERLVGFIGLGRGRDGRLLTSEDLQLVAALAGYAAIAIHNAQLYRSLESNAAQLADLKGYNENVIESIAVGVVVVSPEGEITTWNSTMETLYGLPRDQAMGRNLDQIFPESLLSSIRPFLSGTRWSLTGAGRLHKTHLQPLEGEARMVNITLAPFVSTSNMSAGTLLAFDDITDKARLENQLLQAEKLSSIGLFAAGIAHEVNTPLTGISSYVQMLIKETPPDNPNHKVLQRIEQQTFRASDIVNNLLNFARVSDTDLQAVNLNELVVKTVSLLDHPMRKSKVKVEMDLDSSLPETLGNGGKLQQVFMNLFLNAKDAMPEGGELRISTRGRNSSLVVRVQDSGQGISRENIKKIYDPFFTTKEIGKGTGLGLSVSYGIIQEHSGRISVDSQPGRGTVFVLELPVKRVN